MASSWTTPKTFSDSVSLTAAELNTYLSDAMQYLYDRLGTQSAVLSSNVTTNTATWGDLTGLAFTCTSGKNYSVRGFLTYEASSTSLVPQIGVNYPGGSVRGMVTIAGDTSTVSLERDWVTTTDTSGITTTPNATGTAYAIWVDFRYQCTSSGTFALRIARGTTGTLTIHKGSGITITSD